MDYDEDEVLITEPKYRPTCLVGTCLIGNWNEDQLKKKEKVQNFIERRERGELLLQKSARISDILLEPVQLSASDQFVCFDQPIQLISEMPKTASNLTHRALSITVNELEEIDENCMVTCGPADHSCIRNTFIIRLPHRISRESSVQNQSGDKYLKYGQKFYLECTDRPLLLYSAPKTPLDFNPNCAFKVHGEIKQSVGLKLQDTAHLGGNVEPNTKVPFTFCLWHCYHINPDVRFETIGDYVPSDGKVIIEHAFTKKLLACEQLELIHTIFGMECGVTCSISKDIYGMETAVNIWQLSSKTNF